MLIRTYAMDVPLFIAGLLALVAASVHGIGGDRLVLQKLWREPLPRTYFGGPAMTRSMIHVTWHVTTFAFLSTGVGMVLSASVLDGDAADAVAAFCAAASTGFAAIAAGMAAARHPPRALAQHPGPVVLALTAALAWWGAL